MRSIPTTSKTGRFWPASVLASRHFPLLVLLLLFLIYGQPLGAEGIPELKPSNDEVRLIINRSSDSGGGRTRFAGWGSTDPFSRLYIYIADPTKECIFLGLGISDIGGARDLDPEFDGEAIRYRVIAPNGAVVIDRTIPLNSLNITGANDGAMYNNAKNGPSEITGLGYTAGDDFTVTSAQLLNAGGLGGDYYIEFTEANANGNPINPNDGTPGDGAWDGFELEFFDFTVADCSNPDAPAEKKGRVWSYRWELTTTNSDIPFNGAFFVCDEDEASETPDDAFITKIDFGGVGFRPYAFNVFFNSNGLQNTGNPVVDRRSLTGNEPKGVPEHRTFLNDPVTAPTAQFGSPSLEVFFERCGESGPYTYCFLVNADKMGSQIDILLDLNGSPGYQSGTADVVLSRKIGEGEENVDICIPWDGKDGNGTLVNPDILDDTNVIPTYMEGIFHFPIFDAELNSMSFNITYIRPQPMGASAILLKWDDSLVNDAPINGPDAGSPVTCQQVNLDGCPVGSAGCTRCWTEFDYGDRATLNTYWTSLTLPLDFTISSTGYYNCQIAGENVLCPGDDVLLAVELTLLPLGASAPNSLSFVWEGPNGPVEGAAGPALHIADFDPATDAGTYTATVYFGSQCSTSCSINLQLSDECQADLSITKSVDDHTPMLGQLVNFTVVVANDGPIDATNVTIEDEIPDGYSMINVTDGVGVYNPASGKITWNIASLPVAPGSNTVTFTYTAKVVSATNYTNVVQITASDQDDVDSDPSKDETQDENGDGDGFDDDEDFEVLCPTASIAITPGPLDICVGDSPLLTVMARSGGAGNCVIHWLSSTDNAVFSPTGVTGDTYALPNTLEDGVYYFKAEYRCDGDYCEIGQSNVTKVTVVPNVSVTVENIIMGVDYATSETCGHFDVLMDVEICNPNPAPVTNLTAAVDLESQSNEIFAGKARILGLVEGDEVKPGSILNPNFDGDNDQNLFKAGSASLAGHSCMRVRIRFEVAPDKAATVDLASSARFVSAVAGSGCTSGTADDSVQLGDCWYRSRLVGANDNIYVSVNDNCKAVITPDMILEGHEYDCEVWNYPLGGYYRVRILYPGQAEPSDPLPWVEVCANDFPGGMVVVYVELISKHCLPFWGKVTLEDKRKPYFECAPEEVTSVRRRYQVQTADGYLEDDNDGKINFSDYSCFQDEKGTPDDCVQPYDVLEFYVSKADIYTFEAWDPGTGPDQVDNDDELLLALYQGDFDPRQPCSNIIGQSNAVSEYGVVDNGRAPDSRIRIAFPLQPGKKYSLLVAQDDCPDDKDAYRIYAFSDQGGQILDGDVDDSGVVDNDEPADNFGLPRDLLVEKELFCSDVEYVLNNSDYTPNPVVNDNCDENPEVWFVDKLNQRGDCGAISITRTWYVRDRSGNLGQTCTQNIRFKRPGLEDVQKPATTVPIECDELGPEWLDENGRPKPEVAGYPFIITAFGIKDLDQALCNIGADYRDISVINVCENTQKIVRQWIILDWCDIGGQWELNNGIQVNWRQIIKTGDFTAPVVTIEGAQPVIPSGSLSCAGDMTLPGVQVTDNCSAGYSVIATVYRVTDGTETKIYEGTAGDIVRNVAIGATYRIEYEVEDVCGNTARTSYTLMVEDMLEPVAICDDNLKVTLGGDGIGRLTAADVDEGSYDNCELKDIYVSRKLVTDDLRDSYLQTVRGLTFDALKREVNAEDLDQNAESEIWVRKSNGEKVLRKKDGMWYTWWDEEIWFICQDPSTPVVVELLVRDIQGLTNVCWQTVVVEDKLAPVCEAPRNYTETCTWLPSGFDPQDDGQLAELFGMATGQGACSAATARQTTKTVEWDCSSGTITRTFVVQSPNGKASTNACRQVITVVPQHDYEIKFPKDAVVDCSVPSPDTLLYEINACDLLTVSVKDERFDVSGEACYKIRRTYKVINWCEYNGDDHAVVVSRDHDCDGVAGNQDIYVLRRANGNVFFDRNNSETDGSPVQNSRGCNPGNPGGYWEKNAQFGQPVVSTGYWEYTQIIKVEDTTSPEIAIDGEDVFCSLNHADCDGIVNISFRVSDACAGSDVSVQAFVDGVEVVVGGTYPDFSTGGRYGLGEHQLEVRTVDGCGQTQRAVKSFSVVDCKAPVPECINGLVVELMPVEPGIDADGDGDEDKGAVSIRASDFKVKGLEDCTEPVTLSINRIGETPNRDQAELVLTCDDPDTLVVEIYAWDSADNPSAIQPDGSIGGANFDKCITYVLLQDNMFRVCDDQNAPAAISGLIANQNAEPVEFVDVYLTGGMTYAMQTGETGRYGFSELTPGLDYTITPQRDDDHRNGVNTLDLIKINKHILGSARLSDPYQLIAADVNHSGSVSTLDMIQIRKLVLGAYSAFPDSKSWRFIPVGYNFPDPDNPWTEVFPEVLNYNNVAELITSGNFIGVKVGDVDGNARPNSRHTLPRNLHGVLRVETMDRDLKAGKEYHISFTAKDIEQVQGYQFTLNFDAAAADLIDVEYALARPDNFGLAFVQEGAVTVSWNPEEETNWQYHPATLYDKLFTLVLRAKKEARLSEVLTLNSRFTPAEAYDPQDEYLDVSLVFSAERTAAGRFELYQNLPNPWRDKTVISFHLPEADAATITIFDISGRQIRVIRANFDQGYHQIELDDADLSAAGSGVLYYRLETSIFSATRKMIRL